MFPTTAGGSGFSISSLTRSTSAASTNTSHFTILDYTSHSTFHTLSTSHPTFTRPTRSFRSVLFTSHAFLPFHLKHTTPYNGAHVSADITLRKYTFPQQLAPTTTQQLMQLYMTTGHSKEHYAAALRPRRKRRCASTVTVLYFTLPFSTSWSSIIYPTCIF